MCIVVVLSNLVSHFKVGFQFCLQDYHHNPFVSNVIILSEIDCFIWMYNLILCKWAMLWPEEVNKITENFLFVKILSYFHLKNLLLRIVMSNFTVNVSFKPKYDQKKKKKKKKNWKKSWIYRLGGWVPEFAENALCIVKPYLIRTKIWFLMLKVWHVK